MSKEAELVSGCVDTGGAGVREGIIEEKCLVFGPDRPTAKLGWLRWPTGPP